MHPVNVTPHRYADDLVAKLCKVANVYDERTLNDNFIEDIEVLLGRSLRRDLHKMNKQVYLILNFK